MRQILRRFLHRWVIDMLAVLAAASVLPGIRYDRWPDLLLASLMLGIVNAFVRPVLLLLTLPLVFLSLGLFVFVINALMLLLVEQIVTGLHVDGPWAALGGALIITLVSTILGALTGRDSPRTNNHQVRTGKDPGPPPGDGPVIDV